MSDPWLFNWYTVPTIVAMVVFWPLGLYILTRSPRSLLSIVAAAALFATGEYLFGDVMAANTQSLDRYLDWAGRPWLGAGAAPALWYWLTALLVRSGSGEQARRYLTRIGYPAGLALGAAALAFAILGQMDGPLQRWGSPLVILTPPPSVPSFHGLPGPYYGWYVLYLLIACVFAIWHAVWLVRRGPADEALRARHRWFAYTGVTLLVASVSLAVNVWQQLALPAPVGHLGLAAGLGLMAWNVARYNALIEERVLKSDFLAFLGTMLGIGVLYGAAVLALLRPFTYDVLAVGLGVVLLALTTHALGDLARTAIDRLFFRSEVHELRTGLRQLAEEAATAPELDRVIEGARDALDRAAETELRRLVEDALRRLNDLPALAGHPLLDRLAGAVDRVALPSDRAADGRTPLLQARALRQLLIDRLAQLKPAGDPPKHLTGGWLQYVILREAYVEGRPNKHIMRSHEISEGTFHRSRRQAIAGLAADLARLDPIRGSPSAERAPDIP